MRNARLFFLSFFVVFPAISFSQPTDFSQENASAILKTLVLDIGPRPMGSPAEQRALEFAVAKFDAYGCDSSYVLPMTVAAGVNTKSGVAVGVKKGKSDRIIVIGGHIDSSGPDVPGANDDGSGTACVLELARVLCRRENESTIYFCCWGGEEQGLRGSEFFVENFEHLDSVALMLQIDMADGSSYLIVDPDGSKNSAPAWLVKSAFDIFYREVNSSGLVYQTGMATVNLSVGGAFGSDHVPFIDKGIPAIDLTSDVTLPIHTPQDSWENFDPSGLKRSGDLVLKLFERYDGGVPSRSTERYQIFQVGNNVFTVSYPLLWSFVGISILCAFIALAITRRRRSIIDPATRIKWSGFKILVATIIVQVFIWNSETLIGLVKGYRFPWVNNFAGFWLLGILSGLLGLWLVLQLLRRYKLTEDAYVYARVALILFFLFTVLASLSGPELAMYPAAALLLFSIALLVRLAVLRLVFFCLAGFVLYKLAFFDGIGLVQRLLASGTMHKYWQFMVYESAFVLIYSILSLPFAYGIASVYRSSGVDLLWLKKFRNKGGLIAIAFAASVVAVYLVTRPVYGQCWYDTVKVEQQYTLASDSSLLEIKSTEPLKGLSGTIDSRDTVLAETTNYAFRNLPNSEFPPWSSIVRETNRVERSADTTWSMERTIEINSRFRPLRIDVVFESDVPFEVASVWAHGGRTSDPARRETNRRKRFTWYAFPDTHLVIPITFAVTDTQKIAEEVRIQFDSLASPLQLHREFTNVSYRTFLTALDTFSVKSESQQFAGQR